MTNVNETQKQTNKTEVFRGFSLFNDIDDLELRRRNRAVIMTNLLEDNFVDGKISAKGSLLIIGYMSKIPEKDRAELMVEFVKQANDRGFDIE